MKYLLAALLLSASVATAHAHEWYSGLKSPVTGGSCCSERDCQPTSYCSRDDGTLGIMSHNGRGCVEIDERLILDVHAPDGGVHICERQSEYGATLCIILGGVS